ncbi:MAG: NAD(P)-dependent oxidoreductase [Acidilobaceae archaeon]
MVFTPLYIDLSGFRVLVVGGGYVGARRALFFKEAGARVTVAAKEFRKELTQVDGIELVRVDLPRDMALLEELIKTHDLIVIAVSDDQLAEEVAEKALRERKLVNNSVDYRKGNVIVPFRALAGGLGVAVTSFGSSGMAARVALEKAVEAIAGDPEVRAILESFGKLKRQLRETVRDPRLRMRIYMAVEEDALYRELVKRGNARGAYERALEVARGFGVSLQPLDDSVLEERQ